MESGGDWQTLQDEIKQRRADSTLSASSRRYMSHFDSLPRTLNDLIGHFEHALHPHKPQMHPLWGLWYVNLKVNSDVLYEISNSLLKCFSCAMNHPKSSVRHQDGLVGFVACWNFLIGVLILVSTKKFTRLG